MTDGYIMRVVCLCVVSCCHWELERVRKLDSCIVLNREMGPKNEAFEYENSQIFGYLNFKTALYSTP